MSGGLYDPLGAGRQETARRDRGSARLVAAGLMVGGLVAFGVFLALRGGGERGEPQAIVTIEHAPTPIAAPPQAAVAIPAAPPPSASTMSGSGSPGPTASAPMAPAAGREANVEIQNGVRIIRMRSDPAHPTGQVTIVPPVAPGSPPSATTGLPTAGAR